jgi:hypothetical protein
MTAAENSDTQWTTLENDQNLNSGTFELAFDPHNRIVYSANLAEGMLALKLAD